MVNSSRVILPKPAGIPENDALIRIFRWTRLHTWYVQYVCSIIYEQGYENIDVAEVNRVLHRIMTDFEPQYINYRNLLQATSSDS
ncbi:MAG: hypothetical protein R2756_08430 [Bacteroidales bacterium]